MRGGRPTGLLIEAAGRLVETVIPEPGAPEAANPDPALAEIGKKLVGADGFGCTTCHGVGPVKPTAAFEVEGVNFALSHERLRKEWFMRWMDNPQSVTPGSKMPRYSENGKSQRPRQLADDDLSHQHLHALARAAELHHVAPVVRIHHRRQ